MHRQVMLAAAAFTALQAARAGAPIATPLVPLEAFEKRSPQPNRRRFKVNARAEAKRLSRRISRR